MLFTNCGLNAAEKTHSLLLWVVELHGRKKNETRAAWEATRGDIFSDRRRFNASELTCESRQNYLKANRFGNDPWTRGEAKIFIQNCLSSSCIQVAPFFEKILWNSISKKNYNNKSINNNYLKKSKEIIWKGGIYLPTLRCSPPFGPLVNDQIVCCVCVRVVCETIPI